MPAGVDNRDSHRQQHAGEVEEHLLSAPVATDQARTTGPDRVTRIVMLGRQGSGKGTQCERLAKRCGVTHLSTGALFRDAVVRDSSLGRSVKTLIEAGDLVPDERVVEIVAERLARVDIRTQGFVLDGFPRTVEQAEALDVLLGPDTIDAAINLAVNPRVALERLLHRRVCVDCGCAASVPANSVVRRCTACGGRVIQRDDDNRSSITRRLSLYEQQTKPILAWYANRGLLATVDGHGSPDEVAARVERTWSAWGPVDADIG